MPAIDAFKLLRRLCLDVPQPELARELTGDAALREARRRGLFAPLIELPGKQARFLGNLPDRSEEQGFAAVAETEDGPIVALATTRPGQGVRQVAVVRGEYAREGMAGLENALDTFELPPESLELVMGAALAEGLESGRLAPAGVNGGGNMYRRGGAKMYHGLGGSLSA